MRLKKALGVEGAAAGTAVELELDGVGRLSGEVDFANENFLGLRTADTLYRFFGRNAFGATVGMTVHDFSGSGDSDATAKAWGGFLGEGLRLSGGDWRVAVTRGGAPATPSRPCDAGNV